MNTGVIDRFTEVFTRYIDSGFGLLGGERPQCLANLLLQLVALRGGVGRLDRQSISGDLLKAAGGLLALITLP